MLASVEVEDAQGSFEAGVELWRQAISEEEGVPLVKTLALGGDGEFQFKHLSLQEKLFVDALLLGEADEFWSSDEVLCSHLLAPLAPC